MSTVVESKSYQVTRVGLVINEPMSFAEWVACGRKLTVFATGLAFAIGDWLVYGDGRGEFGDTYTEAQRLTGKSFESLAQYASVSRAFPIEQRDPRVPWSLYRLARALEDGGRRRAIHLAAEKSWTQRDMLAHVRTGGAEQCRASSRQERDVSAWRPPEQQAKKARIECPSCGHRFDIRRKT